MHLINGPAEKSLGSSQPRSLANLPVVLVSNRTRLGSWYIVNLVFNKIIYDRFYAWWSKYNYVLAAALDTGLAISGIVIFFAGEFLWRIYTSDSRRQPLTNSCCLETVSYGPNVQFPDWWGNTV